MRDLTGPWTHFMDMHSGGRQKEDFQYLLIQAPQEEAELIFFNRFGHNPNRVSCACCGTDYSIRESEDFAEATAYDRGCAYTEKGYVERPSTETWASKYLTVDEYIKSGHAVIIYKDDISPDERKGTLPQQGYTWID